MIAAGWPWLRRVVLPVLALACTLQSEGVRAQIVDPPYPHIIREIRGSVFPILAYMGPVAPDSLSLGTCFLVGKEPRIFVVTCDHVVATKNTGEQPSGYAHRIEVLLQSKRGRTVPTPARVVYGNRDLDFAVLELDRAAITDSVAVVYLQPSLWRLLDDVREGETVLYTGFPLGLGASPKYPLSRIGIVAQIPPGRKRFVVDGSVQHGHSGSPVFTLVQVPGTLPPKWNARLVGIATAFPKEYTDVLGLTGDGSEMGRVVLNPGFTFVTPMDEIARVLADKFDVR